MALTPVAAAETELVRLRRYADLLDAGIKLPVLPWRVGLDPILGLIPGFGDGVGAVLAGWIMIAALRRAVPGATLARMAWNIAIDTLVGAIPVVGDIFDFAWKSNQRNVALLERHARDHQAARIADRRYFAVLAAAVVIVCMASVAAGAWIFVELLHFIAR